MSVQGRLFDADPFRPPEERERERAWASFLGDLSPHERDRALERGEIDDSGALPPRWRWFAGRAVTAPAPGAVYGEAGPGPADNTSGLLWRRGGLAPRSRDARGRLLAATPGARGPLAVACVVDAVWWKHLEPAYVLVRRWTGPGHVAGNLGWLRWSAWAAAPLVLVGEDREGLEAWYRREPRGKGNYPWRGREGYALEALDASSASGLPGFVPYRSPVGTTLRDRPSDG